MKETLSAHQRRLEQRRMKAAALFRRGKTQAEVSRTLIVSYQSVHDWHVAWRKRGAAGLQSKGKPGKKPALTVTKRKRVAHVLLRGPEASGFSTPVWTLERIRTVIQRTAGVTHHPSYVWKVLTDMGWSCQKPIVRAKERDEEAIRAWVAETWPRLKKGDVVIV